MWSDAKGSYLASLTMHFHPVREVEVAVRPIRIRLLHHNTFDTYFMDEWLAEHRR
jgi:hypothetical protein